LSVIFLNSFSSENKAGICFEAEEASWWGIRGRQVELEKFDAGLPLKLEHLDGTWLLQYTTAPDVISLLQASQLPFLQVFHSHPHTFLSVCLSLSRYISLTSFSFSETKFKRNFSSCNWLRYRTDQASGCCTLQTDWGSDLEELGNSWSRFWVFTIAEELFNNLKRSCEKVFGHSSQVLLNLGARMFLELTHVQRVPWQTDNMGWASKAW
jgi:hypothetical protein